MGQNWCFVPPLKYGKTIAGGLAASGLEKAQQDGKTQNLPHGLGRLHGGHKRYQHGVPQVLASEEDKGDHDYDSQDGGQYGASRAYGVASRAVKGFGLGEAGSFQGSVHAVVDETTNHFLSEGKKLCLLAGRSTIGIARSRDDAQIMFDFRLTMLVQVCQKSLCLFFIPIEKLLAMLQHIVV